MTGHCAQNYLLIFLKYVLRPGAERYYFSCLVEIFWGSYVFHVLTNIGTITQNYNVYCMLALKMIPEKHYTHLTGHLNKQRNTNMNTSKGGRDRKETNNNIRSVCSQRIFRSDNKVNRHTCLFRNANKNVREHLDFVINSAMRKIFDTKYQDIADICRDIFNLLSQ